MDADQIIQTARANLQTLLNRARRQSAELTDAGGGGEYVEVRQALDEGARSLEAVRDWLAKLDISQTQQETNP